MLAATQKLSATCLLALVTALLVAYGLSTAISAHASGTIRYVATSGSDSANDCSNSVAPCATIQYAVDQAAPGDEVRVASGTYTESFTLNKAVNLVGADTGTTILNAFSFQRVLTITGASITQTTIISGLTFANGVVTSTNLCPESCGGGMLITDTAQPLLKNLVFRHNLAGQWGGGLYANTGSPLTLDYVTFTGNSSSGPCCGGYGGGGAFVAAPTTLLGGLFQHNSALYGFGGGLYATSTLTLTGTQFVQNSAWGSGGGAYVIGAGLLNEGLFLLNSGSGNGGGLYEKGALTLTGTQFLSNTGGGAYVVGAALLTDGLFLNNNSYDYGGGLYASSTLATLNTQFLGNTAQNRGGGVYASSATLNGGLFQNNSAWNYGIGGGVWANSLAMSGTQFLSNTAIFGYGGGAYVVGMANLNAGRFETNKSTYDGAGLWANTLLITGTQFFSNTAGGALGGGDNEGNGGGAYVAGLAILNGGLFQNNAAGDSNVSGGKGGGVLANSLTLNSTQFINNFSQSGGGGASVSGTAFLTGGLFQNNSAAFGSGGGLSANSVLQNGTQYVGNVAGTFASGGGLHVAGAAILNGGLLQMNVAGAGGGLDAGTLTLTDTQFLSNTAYVVIGSSGGGGARVNGWASLNGGLFRNNSGFYGSGLYASGALVLTGTQFISNSDTGAYAATDATLSGGLFQHNARGLYVSGALIAKDTRFLSNTLGYGGGGGAYVLGPAMLDGGVFQNNVGGLSSGDGGGLYAGSTLALTGTQFISNTAPNGGGGGAYVADMAHLSGGLFENNAASFFGGGLDSGGALTLTGTQFISNSSSYAFGGAYVSGLANLNGGIFQNNARGGLYAGTLTVTGTQFFANTASNGAGGIAVGFGTTRIVNAIFERNSTAGGGGAAISSFSSGNVQLVHTTITSPTLASQPAIVMGNGTLNISNTVIASHTVGISMTVGTTATINGVLWFGNGSNTGGAGVVSAGNEHTGDPAFATDGYHLTAGSAAIDSGISAGVAADIDGDPRPLGSAPDLGADEYVPVAPNAVAIAGPGTSALGVSQHFISTIDPITASYPFTYVWRATGQLPVTHTLSSISDALSFNWPVAGTQMITVSASNIAGSVSAVYSTEIAVAPGSLVVLGSPTIQIGASYTPTVEVLPVTTSLPITFVWQATNQAPVTHTVVSNFDEAGFLWNVAGPQVITITAMNAVGVVSAVNPITVIVPVLGALVSGPSSGVVGVTYLYTVTANPLTATLPITYVWKASGHAAITHSVAGASDNASFAWGSAGPQVLTVTLQNVVGVTRTSYAIQVNNPAPIISALGPVSATAGGPTFTLSVTGTNFITVSVVRWNGADLSTTYINGTQLQAAITAADIVASGTVTITVFNPAPVGGVSAGAPFEVSDSERRLYLPLIVR